MIFFKLYENYICIFFKFFPQNLKDFRLPLFDTSCCTQILWSSSHFFYCLLLSKCAYNLLSHITTSQEMVATGTTLVSVLYWLLFYISLWKLPCFLASQIMCELLCNILVCLLETWARNNVTLPISVISFTRLHLYKIIL